MYINIKKFIKIGKNIVIDLNEIEYLIDDKAMSALKKGARKIELVQLYDQQRYLVDSQDIQNSLLKKGVIDYLDKKN